MVGLVGAGGAGAEEEEEEPPAVVGVLEGSGRLQDGQVRVLVIVEEWRSRHCQWKWQPQGRRTSSGTVCSSSSAPESSGSRVRVRGSWQDLQVSAMSGVSEI
jgi:hypothetical protein